MVWSKFHFNWRFSLLLVLFLLLVMVLCKEVLALRKDWLCQQLREYSCCLRAFLCQFSCSPLSSHRYLNQVMGPFYHFTQVFQISEIPVFRLTYWYCSCDSEYVTISLIFEISICWVGRILINSFICHRNNGASLNFLQSLENFVRFRGSSADDRDRWCLFTYCCGSEVF